MKCWIVLFVAIVAIQVIEDDGQRKHYLNRNRNSLQYISAQQGDGSTKLYVGNLSWISTDDGLRQLFKTYGQVLDAIVIRDRETGRSRGFGFVTMANIDAANSAIEALNGQDLDGRRIKVNLANPRG